ncbi:MAG: ATP-dependent DNA ligase, partial [Betaproteobacteria bacterium]
MAKQKLADYIAKRKFDATPEPAPAPLAARNGPLLFVIQQHAARRLHYDLRLECDGVLKSWAVPKGPSLDPSEKRLAAQTEDHPFDYASFEGVIPAGQYGAGEMIVWDCGVYSPDEDSEYWFHDHAEAERRVRDALEKGKLGFFLRGEKVKGSFALVRMADKKNWLLIKHKDRFVAKTDLTALDRSVLSNARLDDVKAVPLERLPAERLVPFGDAEKMPAALSPMHAELGDKAFDDPHWMWEPKLDGYRA